MCLKPFLLFAFMFVVSGEAFALVPPGDVPPAPAGVQSPGGKGLPVMGGKQHEQAPQIGMAGETTFPDETLVITGENLDGATLKVWAEGMRFDVKPLRTAGNRMQAVVPKEVDGQQVSLSTMLVWPVKDGKSGMPYRVNGPIAWWSWPCRFQIGQDKTVRIFGKNLSLGASTPVVYAMLPGKPTAVKLEIVTHNPYHVEARLPAVVKPGVCTFQVHNGTGGIYGWSAPVTFEAVKPVTIPATVYKVDDFNPPKYINDGVGDDAAPAIQAAIDAAVKGGGGTVLLSKRMYEVSSRITVPDGAPVVLKGAGMGGWEKKTETPAGDGTVLVVKKGSTFKDLILIDFAGDGSRMEDLTVASYQAAPKERRNYRHLLHIRGHDQVIQRVRLFRSPDKGQAIWTEGTGKLNARIYDCELFYGARGALRMLTGDYVHMKNCSIYGMYNQGKGSDADAIRSMANSCYIMEKNRFQGRDRYNGRQLGRTFLCYNQSSSFSYLADNVSREVGVHPSVPKMGKNVSEQYLFHVGGGPAGGILRVAAAGPSSIRVDPSSMVPYNRKKGKDISTEKNQTLPGSKSEQELQKSDRPNRTVLPGSWVALVVAGKGVGQWRAITKTVKVGHYELRRSWRIVPDKTSRVCIQRMFRHHIVYNNFMSTAEKPEDFVTTHKSTGVYLFHNCMDNVIAGNRIEYVAQGIAIGAFYSTPCSWNLVRDNRINHITGNSGGTTHFPMFINDHIRENPKRASHFAPDTWYNIGNAFRSNSGKDADVIGSVGYKAKEVPAKNYAPSPEKGLMMCVIENNTFEAKRGFIMYAPANWTLLRNNRFAATETKKAIEFYEQNRPCIRETLIKTEKHKSLR